MPATPPLCQCGACFLCRRRAYTRVYRARRRAKGAPPGRQEWLRDCRRIFLHLCRVPSSLDPRRTYALPPAFHRAQNWDPVLSGLG
jgi:hypothetical protein